MEKMDDKFISIVDEYFGIDSQKPIVIGFSGGIDSVCLTTLFMKSSHPLIIAHFNHCLRDTADRDEEFSRVFATERNLLFYSERGDVKKFASDQNLSIEEAARKMRYAFLFRVAQENQVDYLAVGHHADDQIETVLMHLFRGSGMSGLIGMKPVTIIPEFNRSITIIRPLLSFWRAEIEAFCKEHGLSFVQDETNYSDTYERNRIRNHIFPFLKNYYPGVGKRILKLSTLLRDENEILNEIIDENWNDVCLQEHPEFVRIDRHKFNKLAVALQRRLVRKAFFSFDPTLRNLSFENVEWFLNFSVSSKIGEVDLRSNVLAIMNEE
jgi:tRNA(Ile)-lysidine synthase